MTAMTVEQVWDELIKVTPVNRIGVFNAEELGDRYTDFFWITSDGTGAVKARTFMMLENGMVSTTSSDDLIDVETILPGDIRSGLDCESWWAEELISLIDSAPCGVPGWVHDEIESIIRGRGKMFKKQSMLPADRWWLRAGKSDAEWEAGS